MNPLFDELDELKAMAKAMSLSIDGSDGMWEAFLSAAYDTRAALLTLWGTREVANDV